MAAVLYCNGTIICNFGEKSGSLLGKNPASMGGSLASTKKNLTHSTTIITYSIKK